MTHKKDQTNPLGLTNDEILNDYRWVYISRQASLLGRKEVLAGKAKFGIFGDGKELAQVALARSFRAGDWRSGYYRDQTMMFALGISSVREFFAQLYADSQLENEPASAGRQMNSHFATRFIDSEGAWLSQMDKPNSSADASPTACQMGRVLGLAYASKLYRQIPELDAKKQFSENGNEIAFATIGNASTSEGIFWECINAACVLDVPLVVSVWDDDYGISVPNRYQTTKQSISEACKGFIRDESGSGLNMYTVKGWDYPALLETYKLASEQARKDHIPAMIHVQQMSQPQGHSTSGSHERYKTKERLDYEASIDCLVKMRAWLIESSIISSQELSELEAQWDNFVQSEKQSAWDAYLAPISQEKLELENILEKIVNQLGDDSSLKQRCQQALNQLKRSAQSSRRQLMSLARELSHFSSKQDSAFLSELLTFIRSKNNENSERYNRFLINDFPSSALNVASQSAVFSDSPEMVDGRLLIQKTFDYHLARDPRLFIIGEDIGKLGGVNLEFDGLNEKYGDHRVSDTGIREATIFGQGLGAALRGLRPVIDIQYLDYLLYALQPMSDDLASLHYRTAGGQIAPVIIRTKGHRLEGIWHTGSPIGMIVHALRGIHVCVPRNMLQAAGMYNTLLESDDPALVIEVLNAYRVKEALPDNLPDYRVELGKVEVLKQGGDITLVTYGACVAVAQVACQRLAQLGVEVELIDAQTLLPFDRGHDILRSIEKTNALLVLDEDVSGGASSYILKKILEDQSAYDSLDAQPRTLTAKDHRSPYGSDGDYFTKPSVDDVVETILEMMHERDPANFHLSWKS